MKLLWIRAVSLVIIVLLALPLPAMAQISNDAGEKQPLSKEQLAQLLAPVALYVKHPDGVCGKGDPTVGLPGKSTIRRTGRLVANRLSPTSPTSPIRGGNTKRLEGRRPIILGVFLPQ